MHALGFMRNTAADALFLGFFNSFVQFYFLLGSRVELFLWVFIKLLRLI
jgi:hypothetical protein